MKFFATAAKGTEGALRDELRAIRLPRVRADRGGVHFEGELAAGMRACLESRVAVRILCELARFEARDEGALYDGVRAIEWGPHVTPRHTLAVSATCKDSNLTHSHYIALKTKDAVVDQLRDRFGSRPDVNPEDPDVAIVVRLVKNEATVYLDLSGESLHRRGYRVALTDAMMKESLAAAVIALSGWTPNLPFVDPMAGSGTLAIEAAMISRRMAPGLRREFAFERWASFEEALRREWTELRECARARELPRTQAPIFASDGLSAAVEATRRNAERAGVVRDLDVSLRDARDVRVSAPEGHVVTDPPYGDRLSAKPLQLAGFFRQLGDTFRAMRGWTVTVLSGNPLFQRNIGMTPELDQTLFNGPIECHLVRYRVRP
jgi:putative N6-adenine-specific DNA methylase